MVPALLLLLARDLLLHDPLRVLAWRLLHDPRLGQVSAWLRTLLPRPSGAVDADPIALLLGAAAAGFALAYLLAALLGARPRLRAWLLGSAALVVVAAPTAGLIALGVATGRPYGQDGGVVQIPLALDKILAGDSPYGADYSDSILGKQARVSSFWDQHGGNPILRHHAYLPGTHALMLPAYLLGKNALGFFDSRLVTLPAWGLAAALAWLLFADPARRLTAAAVVLVNPLVYWHQVFGANDVMLVALLLAALALFRRGRVVWGAAVLGFACATKQLAWPFAPFLLLTVSGAENFRDLFRPPAIRRLARPLAALLAVFLAVVAPIAARDLRAFWGDIVVYNVGLPGADNYPLGGTPGFGFANFLIDYGAVHSLGDYFPFGIFYVLLAPLGLLLLRRQLRDRSLTTALALGSVALLASLYFSRVVHPNYLVLVAVLLPLAGLAGSVAADVALVPLLLLATAVEVVEHEVFRLTWEQATPALSSALGVLAPGAGPDLTRDPLGLLVGAAMAGAGVAYAAWGSLGAGLRIRRGLLIASTLVAVLVPTYLMTRASAEAVGRGLPVRAQDPWLAEAMPGREVREAWSSSFKKEPPLLLSGPAPSSLAWLLRLTKLGDPRVLTLMAGLGLLAAARRLRGGAGLAAGGAVLLVPGAALGAALGSPELLGLAFLAFAWWLGRRGWPGVAGGVLGVAAAWIPMLLFALPFVLFSATSRSRRQGLGAIGGWLLGQLPGLLVSPGLTLVKLFPEIGPAAGLGMSNVFLYWGAEAWWLARALGAILPMLAVAGAVVVARELGEDERRLLWAAAFLLLGLLVSPQVAALALSLPIALLALAACRGERAHFDGAAGGLAGV
ncbi:MAG TPA: glycosyltransferase 87 family protein [Vicinamibacteria bacterium]|nr:glycosyltransferase 87 family protein [Vicinamibacteria bacterium]